MSALLRRAQRGLLFAVVGLLCLSLFSPIAALAATDLIPGDAAVAVDTDGNGVLLRGDASYDAAVVIQVDDGTEVHILTGPISTDDGSLWYQVSVWGQSGYLPAAAVEAAGNDSSSTSSPEETTEASEDVAEEAAAPVIPWQEPIDYGVVVNNTGDLPADGLACRVDASADAEIVVRIAAGNSVEITGQQVWARDTPFYPVNCAGQGGFVNGLYVELASEQDVATEEEVVAEEAATEDVGTEEVATEEVATEEVVTEEVAAEEVVTEEIASEEAVTEEVTTGEVATDGAETEDGTADETAPEEVVDDEVTSNDVVPEDAATGEAVAEAVTGDVPSADEIINDVPSAEEITDEVNADLPSAEEIIAGLTGDTPSTEGTASDEAATEDVATDDGVIDDAMTDEETLQEGVAEEDGVDAATPEAIVAEDVTTEEDDTEELVSEDLATPDDVATGGATPEAGTQQETATEDVATEDVVTEEAATEDVATDEAATDDVATDEAATDEAATDAAASDDAAGEEAAELAASAAIGSAIVTETNGAGLRCHVDASADSPTITVLSEGTSVPVLGHAQDGWLPIVCGNVAGFADVNHLYAGGASAEELNSSSSGVVRVSNTGGAGLNCRTSPLLSASVITVLTAGSTVSVRGDAMYGWMPVACGGQTGYVSIDYLSPSESGSGSENSGGGSTGSAVVSGTNGDGLRCRTGTGTGTSTITVVPEGRRVTTTGTPQGSWQPVVCAGQNGYMHTDYLSTGDESDSGNNGGGNDNDGGGSTIIGTARVANTGGDGLRCRSSASTNSSTITVVPEGATVSVRGNATGSWLPIVCGGQNGYMHLNYLSIGNIDLGTGTNDNDNGGSAGGESLSTGDHARVTANLNLRYEPSLGSGVAIVAPAGTVVEITGGATNGFYPMDWDGLRGYMSGDYLAKTSDALSQRGGSGDGGNFSPGDGGGGSATGNAMVDFAMGYLGYPYVWATAGPASFDCSGFTYWVVKNVLGRDIGRGLWTQVSAGPTVSRSNLQPGDIVFFQNTYKAGLSHVGLYIGGGQFIHAQNAATGVVISDLGSNYYSSRWYGAVRLT